jgi:hypothetical protein
MEKSRIRDGSDGKKSEPGWKKVGTGIRDGKQSDPGSGMEKSEPGSGMGKSRNRDLGWKKVGSGMEKSRNRDPGWKTQNSRIRDPGWKQVGPGINTGSKTDAPDGRPGEEYAGAPGPGHGHAAGGAREIELLARHEHLFHLLSCRYRRYLE